MKKRYQNTLLLLIATVTLYVYAQYRSEISVDSIRMLVQGYGMLAPAVFGIIYIGFLVFLFPATLMSVLAGVLFGKVLGSITVIVAATIAAAIAFYVTRYFGTGVTEYLEKGVVSNLIKKLNKQCEKGGIRTWFIIRSLFLPYIPVSYAAGLIRKATFKEFILGTLITNAIYSPIFVYFGDQAMQGPKALILPAMLIVVVLLVPRLAKRAQT